ncbi:MAG: hypothetical protein K0R75_1580 [Paenibacillaceae bacterium]|jgi:multiple sugar transport system substrate-binding protein|nr:hypothetical protein [Paenibacillaceae bacterium]
MKGKRFINAKLFTGLASIMLVFAISACGTQTDKPDASANTPPASAPAKETAKSAGIGEAKLPAAELLIYSKVSSITDDEFKQTMEAPIKKKYPQYKLNYLLPGKDQSIEKMVAAGTSPDIVITSFSGMNSDFIPYGLQYDLTPLIKKYNYDLNRIEPTTISSLRDQSGKGELYGLPKYLNGVTLFYNKAIFDKFGVKYPTDGMTWDQAIALAKQMTRTDGGINYRGMSLFYSNMINENQLSLPFIDPTANKAVVNVPGFQKLFQTYKAVYDITGNKPDDTISADKELTQFHKDKNVAMVMSPMSGYGRFVADPTLDWDMVAAPTFADKPKVGFQANTIYYFVSNANKHAEQAFQVVTEFLTDDVQLAANKVGRPTSLANQAIRDTLGQDDKVLKTKNFKAFFYNKFAETPKPNLKLSAKVSGNGQLGKDFAAMIHDGTDVNTMLRQSEEAINQQINAALNQ